MAISNEKLFNAYLQHYQRGNGPVFRGTPFQGQGFKDIVRTGWRFVSPILAHLGESFLGETAGALSRGANLKDAVKSAVSPALRSGVNRAITRVTTGQGRRIRKKRRILGLGRTARVLRPRHKTKPHKKTHTGGRRKRAKHYKRLRRSKEQLAAKFPFSNF